MLEIKEEFYQTLKSTEWMETQTRKNAIDKLKAMEFRIGFPDEILIDELINDYYKEVRNYLVSSFYYNINVCYSW